MYAAVDAVTGVDVADSCAACSRADVSAQLQRRRCVPAGPNVRVLRRPHGRRLRDGCAAEPTSAFAQRLTVSPGLCMCRACVCVRCSHACRCGGRRRAVRAPRAVCVAVLHAGRPGGGHRGQCAHVARQRQRRPGPLRAVRAARPLRLRAARGRPSDGVCGAGTARCRRSRSTTTATSTATRAAPPSTTCAALPPRTCLHCVLYALTCFIYLCVCQLVCDLCLHA
jgi:hypothetical protein